MLERARSRGQLIISLEDDSDEEEEEAQAPKPDVHSLSVRERVNMLVRSASKPTTTRAKKRTALASVIPKIDSHATASQWRKREEEYKLWLAEQEKNRAELERRKKASEEARAKRQTMVL